jgi:hypothetical protein
MACPAEQKLADGCATLLAIMRGTQLGDSQSDYSQLLYDAPGGQESQFCYARPKPSGGMNYDR